MASIIHHASTALALTLHHDQPASDPVIAPIQTVSALIVHCRALIIHHSHVDLAIAICCVHVAPVTYHVAPPPFMFCLTFVPLIPSPTLLLFLLCLLPVLSASVTARVQPSLVRAQQFDLVSECHNSHVCYLNKNCASKEENQKQEVLCSLNCY